MEPPSEPLVSVYVATRDRWSLLQRALRSVLSQDHPRLEVLVVDDGSQDNTRAELTAWSAVEPRLRVLHQAVSQGAPAARNAALRAAAGEFVTGLDDDDVFQPGRLAAFLRAWRTSRAAHPAPVFLYGVDDVWGAAPSVAHSKPEVADARSLCRANGVGNQVFAPRATWAASGGFAEDLPAWQDLDLWLRMLGPNGVAHLVHDARQALDQSAAHGRISRRPRAELARARDLVVARHARLGSAACFDLYCQMYSRYYGFEPSWDEVRAAARLYPHPRGVWRIMALKWRRRRRGRSELAEVSA